MVATVRQTYTVVLIWKSSLSPQCRNLWVKQSFPLSSTVPLQVEAVKADTGCLVEIELHKVLFTCADGEGGAVPQEGRQVDGGGEDDGQASDEEGGEGGH